MLLTYGANKNKVVLFRGTDWLVPPEDLLTKLIRPRPRIFAVVAVHGKMHIVVTTESTID
jgi:hypothetical protein